MNIKKMNKIIVILSFALMLGIVGICSSVFTQKSTPIASEKIEVAESISSKENKTEEGWKEVLKKIESGEVYWKK